MPVIDHKFSLMDSGLMILLYTTSLFWVVPLCRFPWNSNDQFPYISICIIITRKNGWKATCHSDNLRYKVCNNAVSSSRQPTMNKENWLLKSHVCKLTTTTWIKYITYKWWCYIHSLATFRMTLSKANEVLILMLCLCCHATLSHINARKWISPLKLLIPKDSYVTTTDLYIQVSIGLPFRKKTHID